MIDDEEARKEIEHVYENRVIWVGAGEEACMSNKSAAQIIQEELYGR